jgi:hypothetical protein
MILIAKVEEPALLSYLTAMLRSDGVEVEVNDRTTGNPYFPSAYYELYVAEAQAPAARALLRRLEAADGAKYGVEDA